MIRVLQIRETPLSKCAGVDANCQGLIDLFSGDDTIEMLPTIDYTRHTIPILHQYYLDKDEICRSIERLKPNVVHIHGAYSFTLYVAVQCATKYGIPIVFSPHFHPFWALRRPFMGRLFFNVITKSVLHDVNAVFTINNEDTA
ncbi:MAG: glycosyltransferase, partial [Lachnospiraceae bacterium]|nr:glycosyltransferase [Lachnospiraceae bacterium]